MKVFSLLFLIVMLAFSTTSNAGNLVSQNFGASEVCFQQEDCISACNNANRCTNIDYVYCDTNTSTCWCHPL